LIYPTAEKRVEILDRVENKELRRKRLLKRYVERRRNKNRRVGRK